MENVSASTVGELLRKTREGRKLSLDEVNKHTKISIETLRSLEQDDIETFESEAYLKGFIKNYARFLKLDMDVVMMTLDRQRGRMHLGKGTLWDIEETLKEEKLKSAKLLSRILVPKQHLEESAEALKAAMANVKVGDPNDPETVQGPQCSADLSEGRFPHRTTGLLDVGFYPLTERHR